MEHVEQGDGASWFALPGFRRGGRLKFVERGGRFFVAARTTSGKDYDEAEIPEALFRLAEAHAGEERFRPEPIPFRSLKGRSWALTKEAVEAVVKAAFPSGLWVRRAAVEQALRAAGLPEYGVVPAAQALLSREEACGRLRRCGKEWMLRGGDDVTPRP